MPVGRKVNYSRLHLAMLFKCHQLNLKKEFGFAHNVYRFPLARQLVLILGLGLTFTPVKCLWIL